MLMYGGINKELVVFALVVCLLFWSFEDPPPE